MPLAFADAVHADKGTNRAYTWIFDSADAGSGGAVDAAFAGAEVVISAGPPGVCLVNKAAWAGRPGLLALADLNAVPPLGIEGVEVTDSAAARDGATVYGALGVGNLKMKIHKACIARLFERNDQVLDAETIADVAEGLKK